MSFLDLIKAFCTVRRNIRFTQLCKYSLRGAAYDWNNNYIEEEISMFNSTNMIALVPWISNLDFLRAPYSDHCCPLYMLMIHAMFHLSRYLYHYLQIIPKALFLGNVSNLFETINNELSKLSE